MKKYFNKMDEVRRAAANSSNSNQIQRKSSEPTIDSSAVSQRRPHATHTYIVSLSHANANGGNAVNYYRNGVNGHQAQQAVYQAALARFQAGYPATVGAGAPNRSSRQVANASQVPAGAIQV